MIHVAMSMLLGLVLLVNAGCQRAPVTQSSGSASYSSLEPITGTRIETALASSELSIADRLWVTTTWYWQDGVAPTLHAPDFASQGWVVIESIYSELSRDDRGYFAQHRVLLEPFLPGVYTVPTSQLRVESSMLDEPVVLEIDQMMTIRVLGVLPSNDTGMLNPLAPPTVPDSPTRESNTPLLITIGCVAVFAGITVLYLRRRRIQTGDLSIHEQLLQIRDRQDIQRDHAFQLLERVYDRLDPRLRGTTEFAGMISVCEQARYAADSAPLANPSKLAAFTLELLGDDCSDAAGEGGHA